MNWKLGLFLLVLIAIVSAVLVLFVFEAVKQPLFWPVVALYVGVLCLLFRTIWELVP